MKLSFGSRIRMSTWSALVALVLMFGLVAAPMAFARVDAFGGATFGPTFVPYTVLPQPSPMPDRLGGFLPYTVLPEPHPMPDRLEMIPGYLPYTELTAPIQDRYGHWLVR